MRTDDSVSYIQTLTSFFLGTFSGQRPRVLFLLSMKAPASMLEHHRLHLYPLLTAGTICHGTPATITCAFRGSWDIIQAVDVRESTMPRTV